MAFGLILPELLPAHVREGDVVYVLDGALNVVAANDAWTAFARDNHGDKLLRGRGCVNALDNFSGSDRTRWQRLYQALLAGRLHAHAEDLSCPSPQQRRALHLRVTVSRDADGKVVHLVHHVSGAAETLDNEGSDGRPGPAEIRAEYLERLLKRTVSAPRFAVMRRLLPLEDVGGDLLWHHVRDDGSTDLVLADVAGHGLGAAAMALTIEELLEEAADAPGQVHEQVMRLNQRLCQRHALSERRWPSSFATGVFVRLRPEAQALDICSFAHHGAIFSEAGLVPLNSGLPVGILRHLEAWPQQTLRFDTLGKRLLLFSDGVIEQFNAQGEMFGTERLARAFLDCKRLSLPLVLDHLHLLNESFRGSALIKDDRTWLLLEQLS